MRHLAKTIAYWVLPGGLYRGWSDWRKRPKLSGSERRVLAENSAFKGRHAGERCFILATGPSIGSQDLAFLKDETCIAVSNFIAHPDFEVIRPRYYCLAPRHDPITEQQWTAWLSEIEEKASFSQLFMGLSDRELNTRQGMFEGRVNYLQFDGGCQRSIHDLTKALLPPQSVSVMALMVAVYMQFSDIYLLGCDHSWILHVGEGSHFYTEDQHKMVELGFNEWFKPSLMEATFVSYLRLWRQYKLFLEPGGDVNIYNLSPTSFLDLFPKVSLDQLRTAEG